MMLFSAYYLSLSLSRTQVKYDIFRYCRTIEIHLIYPFLYIKAVANHFKSPMILNNLSRLLMTNSRISLKLSIQDIEVRQIFV